MSEFEQVHQAKTVHKAALLKRPNVVGVGVGYKTAGKRETDELCVVVMVQQKLPPAGLSTQAIIPQEVAGVRTDVIQVGFVRALDVPTDRWRPAPGGVSLGHYQITAGTLGSVVYDRQTGERMILSNNHVLANSNNARLGDPILQPGPADGGQLGPDTIALLQRFVPIRYTSEPPTCTVAKTYAWVGNRFAQVLHAQHRLQVVQIRPAVTNLVDAAVARLIDDDYLRDDILDIGPVNGVKEAALGMGVCKSGRTTAFTTGTIRVLEATISVNYGPEQAATFEGQMVSTPMSQGGDSGSLLVTHDTHQAVGLLFAGSSQATIFNPIQTVLDQLRVEIRGQAASKQAFASNAQIVRQKYQEMLMSKANVVGVGIGLRRKGGRRTEELALVVMVRRKLPLEQLAPEDIIPAEIDGVPVDIREVGVLSPAGDTAPADVSAPVGDSMTVSGSPPF
jgi:hypothetical protein